MIVTRSFLENAIHYIPATQVVYIQNAKAACSSIKKTMWLSLSEYPYDAGRGPHERGHSPFCRSLEDIEAHRDGFDAAHFFSVVRNPYSRTLAAYLDKVGRRPRDSAVWYPFASRHRLSSDAELSFGEFLRLVVSDEPTLLDQHFAPQYVNTLAPFLTLDFVGRMEVPGELDGFMRARGMGMRAHQPHSTGAAQRVAQMYGPREIEIVADYYARDFELFGYSIDPLAIEPERAVQQPQIDRRILGSLLNVVTAPHPDGRRRCIESITANVAEYDADFARLDIGVLNQFELRNAADQCIRSSGKGRNWRYLARLAEELLRFDQIHEAASIAALAREARHGSPHKVPGRVPV